MLSRAASSTIAQRAIEGGMRTLRDDGWNKVRNGITTIEEILRHADRRTSRLTGDAEKAGMRIKTQLT